jgi:hypothetical protein
MHEIEQKQTQVTIFPEAIYVCFLCVSIIEKEYIQKKIRGRSFSTSIFILLHILRFDVSDS